MRGSEISFLPCRQSNAMTPHVGCQMNVRVAERLQLAPKTKKPGHDTQAFCNTIDAVLLA